MVLIIKNSSADSIMNILSASFEILVMVSCFEVLLLYFYGPSGFAGDGQ